MWRSFEFFCSCIALFPDFPRLIMWERERKKHSCKWRVVKSHTQKQNFALKNQIFIICSNFVFFSILLQFCKILLNFLSSNFIGRTKEYILLGNSSLVHDADDFTLQFFFLSVNMNLNLLKVILTKCSHEYLKEEMYSLFSSKIHSFQIEFSWI